VMSNISNSNISTNTSLKFYYIVQGEKPLYLCRSLDIVAHEAGHAFLDILQIEWLVEGQTGALHEAFGDLTTMFTILSMNDMVKLLIETTNSKLRSADNFVAAVGEEFGDLVYQNKGKVSSREPTETKFQEIATNLETAVGTL
ncbi:1700_t:CDS:2, partial [Racocetra fulgida]